MPSRVVSDLASARLAALPYLVVGLCSLTLFRDGLFRGEVFFERDTYLFYEPLTQWFAEQLRRGRIPLWMPLIFGGYPLFADGEIGMLYPPNLLLIPVLPDSIRLSSLRALHLFLAGSFMIALLRQVGLGRWGALVGGLVFAFGSFFVTQIHHENLVRSAVWLPLVLLFVERAFRRAGWSRQRNLVAAGLALAMAAQGLHVQPVAMSLIVLVAYCTYRLVVGPVAAGARERVALLVWAPSVVAAIGAAGAAVQWLPLLELGRTSYRGPGLTYELSAAWPLRWQNLPTIVFPYLFRMEDGRYVTLWQQWESFLYVGIAPLGLAVLAVVCSRHRLAVFFLLVALLGVAIGLADQSPLNLHQLLWGLPGFSSLRAPGRFAYLVIFGVAGLAALGMDWLARRDRRGWPGVVVGLGMVVSSVLLAWLVQGLHSRLEADPVRWLRLVDQHYLATQREHAWLTGRMVYDQLLAGTDLSNPKLALSLVLLAADGLGVAIAARARRFHLAGAFLIAMVIVDLLVFGSDFHPRGRIDDLMRPDRLTTFLAASAPAERVFAESEVAAMEPNRPLYAGVASVTGYSSLQSQRHFEYSTSVDRQPDALLDLWGARYLVIAHPPTDVVIVDGTAYRPYAPLFNGAALNRTGLTLFAIEPTPTSDVRVLATLIDSVEIEQGTPVAQITLIDSGGARQTLTLRAGIDLSENAYERADVQPYVRHARAHIAGAVPDIAPAGGPTRTNLYGASLPVALSDVVQVELRQLAGRGQTRVFGVGLVSPGGAIRSLFSADRAKFREVFRVDGAAVLDNSWAFPRAYVVPDALARRSRSEESALPRLAKRPFDAARQVILEDGPLGAVFDGAAPPEAQPEPGAVPPAAEIEDLSTERVRVQTRDGPGGYLVVTDSYHRGWRATIDGVDTPVYLANFLFRAVELPPGPHTVEFSFDPLSLRIGRALTIATLLFGTAVVFVPLAGAPRRRRPKVSLAPAVF